MRNQSHCDPNRIHYCGPGSDNNCLCVGTHPLGLVCVELHDSGWMSMPAARTGSVHPTQCAGRSVLRTDVCMKLSINCPPTPPTTATPASGADFADTAFAGSMARTV